MNPAEVARPHNSKRWLSGWVAPPAFRLPVIRLATS